jgi:hypothetical protein
MNSVIAYFNKPILRISLLFALATGIAAFVFFLALYLLGVQPLDSVRSFDIGIYVILIASACWYYRKNIGHGFLHLWEALTIGYIITSVAAMINGWLIYLFVVYVDNNVFARYIANALSVLEAGRKTQTEYLSDAEYTKLYETIRDNSPSILVSNEITQKLLMSIIPILVISLIFRKQDYGVYQNKS